MTFTFKLKSTKEILEKRGLEGSGKAQQFVDSEVLRLSDPYIPLDTGTLRDSGIIHTVIGSGKVKYETPYARFQYYSGRSPGTSATGAKRGRLWFERMKADHKDAILRGAAKITGGIAKP